MLKRFGSLKVASLTGVFLLILLSPAYANVEDMAPPQNSISPQNIPVEAASYKTPFSVVAQTHHSSKSSQPRDLFSATLSKEYCLQSACIPKGTVFQGEVVKARPSNRFHMPGYLVFELSQAVFPDGSVVRFPHAQEKTNLMIYNPKSQKFGQAVLGEIPSTVVDIGSSFILKNIAEDWHLKAGMLSFASLGASAAVSVVQEFITKDGQHRSFFGKIGWGVFDSTGIPDVVGFLRREPDAVVSVGEPLTVHFLPDEAKLLYDHMAPDAVIGRNFAASPYLVLKNVVGKIGSESPPLTIPVVFHLDRDKVLPSQIPPSLVSISEPEQNAPALLWSLKQAYSLKTKAILVGEKLSPSRPSPSAALAQRPSANTAY